MSDTPVNNAMLARGIKQINAPFDRLGFKLDRPLDTVPANAEVRFSIYIPDNRVGRYLGLAWIAPRRMTVDEARADILDKLVDGFLDIVMPIPGKER